MPRKLAASPAERALVRRLGRLTLDEELCLSLGYKHTEWPGRYTSDYKPYPRGVWKHPVTGHLHTAQVVALDQKPVDPNGKPFATGMEISELMRAERLEKRTAIQVENAAKEREAAERRRLRKQQMLLA